MQKFYKGRTNNHLTWVMVDATDFATPESAMSAATKIKIYGKLRAAAGVNLVSSGTGSLTNDITHVGASVLGIYSIGLAKADLSDASAAWYDQYIIALSATGAAYQVLVVDGGIDDSNLSGIASDLYSLLSDHHSDFQSRVPKAVATNSQLSDLHSDLKSYLAVMSDVLSDLQSDFQSRVPKAVATNSQLSDLASDLKSYLAVMSGVQSDLYSLASDLQSDFQSRVPKAVATNSQLSDLHSDLKSHLAVSSGIQSDIYSLLSDVQSDFQSRVPKAVANNSQLSDLASDLKSALTVVDDFVDSLESRVPAALSAKLIAHALSVSTIVFDAGCTTTALVLKTVDGGTPSATDDFYNNGVLVITSGTQFRQRCQITDYVGATKTATVSAITGAPADTDTGMLV